MKTRRAPIRARRLMRTPARPEAHCRIAPGSGDGGSPSGWWREWSGKLAAAVAARSMQRDANVTQKSPCRRLPHNSANTLDIGRCKASTVTAVTPRETATAARK
jgi:hypothetical protein